MQDQALILLTIILAVMFVEVVSLLSILLACSRRKKRNKSQASTFTSTQTLNPFENDHDYSKNFLPGNPCHVRADDRVVGRAYLLFL